VCVCVYIYVCVCVWTERERERDRAQNLFTLPIKILFEIFIASLN